MAILSLGISPGGQSTRPQLRLRDSFDVPEEIARGQHSPAFSSFLWNWFGDTSLLTHGEPDITFLKDLTPEELATARGQGNGGQKIYLVPQYDLVAVFTAGGYNAESTPPNTIMAKIILPALRVARGGRGNSAVPPR